MEYTKGEWGITSVAPTIPNVLTIYSNGKRIALVMPNENQKANACLIATAPGIHKALKELLEWARLSFSDDTGEWADENDPAVVGAVKAIAKAEGDK